MSEDAKTILHAIGGLMAVPCGAIALLAVFYGLEWAWWIFTILPRP